MALPADLRAPDARALRGFAGDVTDLYDREAPPWHLPGTEAPVVVAFDVGAEGAAAILGLKGDLQVAPIRARNGRIDPEWRGQVCDVLEAAKVASTYDEVEPHPKGGTRTTRWFLGPIVLIEDAFVPRAKGFGSPKAAISVARWGGAIADMATSFGLPFWIVHPTRWQSKILGGHRDRDGEEGTKATSRLRALELFGVEMSNDHKADAACLAAYGRGVHIRKRSRRK